MKTNDYVKYITQTFVQYMDQPKEDRKKARLEKKETNESFLLKWFGIIPFVLIGRFKRKK